MAPDKPQGRVHAAFGRDVASPSPARVNSYKNPGERVLLMQDKVSFNINAELYENNLGELAVKLPDERVYIDVDGSGSTDFAGDAAAALSGRRPESWRELPGHELLYGKNWRCISRFGFINGEESQPAVEFEGSPSDFGERARAYLGPALS
ncbi:hypothetical protein SAMN05660860_03427 [Geoalkalibacter ferrihydriticus]|nr:hypothetical protein SAMN05660860_03427 [Geoalkalibacter ferrihydriticus]